MSYLPHESPDSLIGCSNQERPKRLLFGRGSGFSALLLYLLSVPFPHQDYDSHYGTVRVYLDPDSLRFQLANAESTETSSSDSKEGTLSVIGKINNLATVDIANTTATRDLVLVGKNVCSWCSPPRSNRNLQFGIYQSKSPCQVYFFIWFLGGGELVFGR
jgi:hypothetical protein